MILTVLIPKRVENGKLLGLIKKNAIIIQIIVLPFSGGRAEVVYVGGVARPAPPVEFAPVGFLDENVIFLYFFINVVVVVNFDVRIDNLKDFRGYKDKIVLVITGEGCYNTLPLF